MGVYSDGVRRLLPTWEPTESFPLCPDAVPMTKAETIMRREEGKNMWLDEVLLYGGCPGGSMVDIFCSGLRPIDWSDGWPA